MSYSNGLASDKDVASTNIESLGQGHDPVSELREPPQEPRAMAREEGQGIDGTVGVLERAQQRERERKIYYVLGHQRTMQKHTGTVTSNHLPIILAAIALATQVGTVGYLYANIVGRIEGHEREITRNFAEDKANSERMWRSIEKTENGLSALHKLTTEVEVMKTKLDTQTEILRRLEWSQIKGSPPNGTTRK